jgi:hypothetical protein
MDSLDGVGLVGGHDLIVDVAPVVGSGSVAPVVGAVAPVVGAVPFCWAHSLKTGSAWIVLDWIALYWIGLA